jgi:bifunctional non-homologous end joining protein LigD
MTANFTHLDKIFWPKERYSKGDVIAYYEKIAPYLLPYVKDRVRSPQSVS